METEQSAKKARRKANLPTSRKFDALKGISKRRSGREQEAGEMRFVLMLEKYKAQTAGGLAQTPQTH